MISVPNEDVILNFLTSGLIILLSLTWLRYMVKVAWDIDVYGTPMYMLTRKLRSVKNFLKAFNFHVFPMFKRRSRKRVEPYIAPKQIF